MKRIVKSFNYDNEVERDVIYTKEMDRIEYPPVPYDVLREIEKVNEVIFSIIQRSVDDSLSNGYKFIGKDKDVQIAEEWWEDNEKKYPELMRKLIHDYLLYGMAAVEIIGVNDYKIMNDELGLEVWDRDVNKPVIGVSAVDWGEFLIMLNKEKNGLAEPPEPAFIQNRKLGFTYNKIKVMPGIGSEVYATPPIQSLLGIIAKQMNLLNYVGGIFSGKIPKQLLIAGDLEPEELDDVIEALRNQIRKSKEPYGILSVNLDKSQAELKQLAQTPGESQFLNTLYYYREEICAVFGIPPIKMGWVQTGKLANPEQQLDTWYDKVESIQMLLSRFLNSINSMIGLKATFKFNSIRPKKDKEKAEILVRQASAAKMIAEAGIMDIEEIRANIFGLENKRAKSVDVGSGTGGWDFF